MKRTPEDYAKHITKEALINENIDQRSAKRAYKEVDAIYDKIQRLESELKRIFQKSYVKHFVENDANTKKKVFKAIDILSDEIGEIAGLAEMASLYE